MALTRSIYSQFEAWKEAPRHGALLVAGARQVGKTFLIRQFARENYEVLLEINFVETPSAKSIFEGDLDAETPHRVQRHGAQTGWHPRVS